MGPLFRTTKKNWKQNITKHGRKRVVAKRKAQKGSCKISREKYFPYQFHTLVSQII
jgi:hypothetical protein